MADGFFSPKSWFTREPASKSTDTRTPEEQQRQRVETLATPFKHAFGQYAHEFSDIYYDYQKMPEPSWGLKREFLQACSTITNGVLSAKDLKEHTNVIRILEDMWNGLRARDSGFNLADEAVAEVFGATSAEHNESALLALNSRQTHETRQEILREHEGTSKLSDRLEKMIDYFGEPNPNHEHISSKDRYAFLSREFPILMERIEALPSLTTTELMETLAVLVKKEQATHRHDTLAWKYLAVHMETMLTPRVSTLRSLVGEFDLPEILAKTKRRDQKVRLAEIDTNLEKGDKNIKEIIFKIETYQSLKLLGNKNLSPEQKNERRLFVEPYKTLSSLLPKDIDALLRATDPADFERVIESMREDVTIRQAAPEMKGTGLYEHRLVANIDLETYDQAVSFLEYLSDSIIKTEKGQYRPVGDTGKVNIYPVHHRHTVQESVEYMDTRMIPFFEQYQDRLIAERATLLEQPFTPRKNTHDLDLRSLKALLLEPTHWEKALADLQVTLRPYGVSLDRIASDGKHIHETWQWKRSHDGYRVDPTEMNLDQAA